MKIAGRCEVVSLKLLPVQSSDRNVFPVKFKIHSTTTVRGQGQDVHLLDGTVQNLNDLQLVLLKTRS